jgi:hypothetical protein
MYNSMTVTSTAQFGSDKNMQLRMEINTVFSNTMNHGKWNTFLKKLVGKNNALQSLAQAENGTIPVQKKGRKVVAVAINQIVGSEGRVNDFDKNFRPLVSHTRDRWVEIAIAQRRDIPLPPVELIQVGDEYYVRDGHHRISVARTFGQAAIEAEIAYELA